MQQHGWNREYYITYVVSHKGTTPIYEGSTLADLILFKSSYRHIGFIDFNLNSEEIYFKAIALSSFVPHLLKRGEQYQSPHKTERHLSITYI